MKSRQGQPAFQFIVNASARSFLSILLSGACVFTLGTDLPAQAADVATTSIPASDKKPKQDPVLKGLPVTELSADEAILHALNRLAYGPRPGDVDRVRQMGLAKWIDQQLNPNSIDDKAVEARLDSYRTLRMSSKQLLAYPQPKQEEKKLEKQQAQAPPTRGDAAAAVVAQDMRAGQSRPQRNDSAAQAGASDSSVAAADAANAAGSMKDPASQANPASGGGGKRGALTVDPNAVPRAIADDSKKPQRVIEEWPWPKSPAPFTASANCSR